jgi:hypothetical protein
MSSLSWSVTVQVSGSPAISVTRAPIEVEATDPIEAVVAPGDSDKVLQIQSGGLSAIYVLLIQSSSYGTHLSFKVSDGAADSSPLVLDSPQLFSGGGVALFTAWSPVS